MTSSRHDDNTYGIGRLSFDHELVLLKVLGVEISAGCAAWAMDAMKNLECELHRCPSQVPHQTLRVSSVV